MSHKSTCLTLLHIIAILTPPTIRIPTLTMPSVDLHPCTSMAQLPDVNNIIMSAHQKSRANLQQPQKGSDQQGLPNLDTPQQRTQAATQQRNQQPQVSPLTSSKCRLSQRNLRSLAAEPSNKRRAAQTTANKIDTQAKTENTRPASNEKVCPKFASVSAPKNDPTINGTNYASIEVPNTDSTSKAATCIDPTTKTTHNTQRPAPKVDSPATHTVQKPTPKIDSSTLKSHNVPRPAPRTDPPTPRRDNKAARSSTRIQGTPTNIPMLYTTPTSSTHRKQNGSRHHPNPNPNRGRNTSPPAKKFQDRKHRTKQYKRETQLLSPNQLCLLVYCLSHFSPPKGSNLLPPLFPTDLHLPSSEAHTQLCLEIISRRYPSTYQDSRNAEEDTYLGWRHKQQLAAGGSRPTQPQRRGGSWEATREVTPAEEQQQATDYTQSRHRVETGEAVRQTRRTTLVEEQRHRHTTDRTRRGAIAEKTDPEPLQRRAKPNRTNQQRKRSAGGSGEPNNDSKSGEPSLPKENEIRAHHNDPTVKKTHPRKQSQIPT